MSEYEFDEWEMGRRYVGIVRANLESWKFMGWKIDWVETKIGWFRYRFVVKASKDHADAFWAEASRVFSAEGVLDE